MTYFSSDLFLGSEQVVARIVQSLNQFINSLHVVDALELDVRLSLFLVHKFTIRGLSELLNVGYQGSDLLIIFVWGRLDSIKDQLNALKQLAFDDGRALMGIFFILRLVSRIGIVRRSQ